MPFLKIVPDFYMWQPYCLFKMNVWLGFIEKCSLYHLLIEALQSIQKNEPCDVNRSISFKGVSFLTSPLIPHFYDVTRHIFKTFCKAPI